MDLFVTTQRLNIILLQEIPKLVQLSFLNQFELTRHFVKSLVKVQSTFQTVTTAKQSIAFYDMTLATFVISGRHSALQFQIVPCPTKHCSGLLAISVRQVGT